MLAPGLVCAIYGGRCITPHKTSCHTTYLDYNVSSKPVNAYIRASDIETQCESQVIAQSVQVTFSLLDLGELLGAAGFCDEVNGELVGARAADKIWEIA